MSIGGPGSIVWEASGCPFSAHFVRMASHRGEIVELFHSGPPWRLTLLARFDDRALTAAGEEIYRNRTVLLVRTRWRRIV